jgi:hypothetical protein
VDIVMPRLRGVDVKRLSGGATTAAAIADASAAAAGERALTPAIFAQAVQRQHGCLTCTCGVHGRLHTE